MGKGEENVTFTSMLKRLNSRKAAWRARQVTLWCSHLKRAVAGAASDGRTRAEQRRVAALRILGREMGVILTDHRKEKGGRDTPRTQSPKESCNGYTKSRQNRL